MLVRLLEGKKAVELAGITSGCSYPSNLVGTSLDLLLIIFNIFGTDWAVFAKSTVSVGLIVTIRLIPRGSCKKFY